MLRIDVIPNSSASTDFASTARQVEQALVSQPAYQELRYQPGIFQSYPSVNWEFLVNEHGVLLHKQDTFFTDNDGNVVAILTQAPAELFPRWRSAFAHVRSSLQVTGSGSPPAAPSSSSAAGFCGTHLCINNFDAGTGYIVQCNDGMWSHSGGLSGACSYHGGESGSTYPGSNSGTYGTGPDLGAGNGYTVTCADGSVSHSGGIQGACSHHSGVG